MHGKVFLLKTNNFKKAKKAKKKKNAQQTYQEFVQPYTPTGR
jgi:hypothetical protein